MKLYQRILAIVVSLPLVIFICGVPPVLLNYLFREFESVRTDGIRETGPIGSAPFVLFAIFSLIVFVILTAVLVISLSQVIMYYFDRYWKR